MKLWSLARLGMASALLCATTTGAVAQDDAAKKLFLGVGNTSSEYWQQMIWGATTMESVDGTVEIISNDFDPQKSMQNMSALVAADCEGCMFTWFPDSPSITKVLVNRVERLC